MQREVSTLPIGEAVELLLAGCAVGVLECATRVDSDARGEHGRRELFLVSRRDSEIAELQFCGSGRMEVLSPHLWASRLFTCITSSLLISRQLRRSSRKLGVTRRQSVKNPAAMMAMICVFPRRHSTSFHSDAQPGVNRQACLRVSCIAFLFLRRRVVFAPMELVHWCAKQ